MNRTDIRNLSELYFESHQRIDAVKSLIDNALSQEQSNVSMDDVIEAFNKIGVKDTEQMKYILVKQFDLDPESCWDEERRVVNLEW
jgi:hypothetical protein